jgi:hypothetical protein
MMDGLQARWEAEWEAALAAWSRFTKLTPPRWCVRVEEERAEGLTGSFAMIRLVDHAVVISLRQVRELGLEPFAREILAHEVGHHVYAPGDLRDNARLLARLRHALPSREGYAGYVGNLYTDLLINDRLQRSAGLDMAGVFRALKAPGDKLWVLYLRTYEHLWGLPRGTLVDAPEDARVRTDAQLCARLVRAYAKDWVRGAGRFGALLLPYLLELPEAQEVPFPWFDTQRAGESSEVPEGLTEVDEDEESGALHPADDPELNGLSEQRAPVRRDVEGGQKSRYREPTSYVDLMQGLGVKVEPRELVMRYYRERALPHLVRFPARRVRQAADPQPEGLDVWDVGSPLSAIDWTGTLAASPVVLPGLTTRERTYGETEGGEPKKQPVDLYVGIDCSGSMSNPADRVSFPVLAGTVVALSALRSGARVMACLSGEPGSFTQTEGFVRDERALLGVLTDYLGTGYAFGIGRLKASFLEGAPPERPTHLLVVSDPDFFLMLKRHEGGWDIARDAAARAGGGATAVLQLQASHYAEPIARLAASGWTVHTVTSQEDLVAFARAFARQRYGDAAAAR